MNSRPLIDSRLRFGPYEFDQRTGELRKRGHFVRVQPQPARVLALLLSRAGEPILREEFQQEIWGGNPLVDVDRSLNFCIRQLRAALNDSADAPRYIETLLRRGYRFIAAVSVEQQGPAVACADLASTAKPLSQTTANLRRFRMLTAALVSVAIIGAGVFYWRLYRPRPEPVVTAVTRLTSDGVAKAPIGPCCTILANDGHMVYFSEFVSGRWVLARVSSSGGEVVRIPEPLRNAGVVDLSIADHRLLVLTWEDGGPILTLPAGGGEATQLGELRGHDASWSPDGRGIVYVREYDLYTADRTGTGERRIAHLSGLPLRPRWSPDGAIIRLTVHDPGTGLESLWEIAPNKPPAHLLFSGDPGQRDECCGAWTADGRYFVYQSRREHTTSLWAIREGYSSTGQNPIRLTTGPIDYLGPSPSPDGRRVFAVGQQKRGELMRYDRVTRRFVTWLSGLSAEGVAFSNDGSRMVWTSFPESVLWRSQADGSARIRLTPAGMSASLPRWSPDGKQILFTGSVAGKQARAYVVAADGGEPHALVPGIGPEYDAGWSPDGQSLVYSDAVTALHGQLHFFDMRTKLVSGVPGSESLFSPRWSPDGKLLAALTDDSLNLRLLDLRTGRWRDLVRGQAVTYPSWSKDMQWICFFSPMEENAPFFRVRVRDGRKEMIASGTVPQGLAAGNSGWWTGLDPNDAPVLLRDTSFQEVYGLSVNWR